MRRSRIWEMSRCGLVLSGLWGLLAPGSRADTIVLRGGGEIQGKLIVDPKTPRTVQVLLLRGRKPLTFQKAQILEVIPKPSALDGYVARKAKLDSTAQAQFELAEWCRANRLTDLAMLHYEAAIERNSSFEEAHKKLGHVLHDGQWLSPDELRKVQGLVRDHGEWITEQEKAKRDESAQMAASQSSWLRRIKLLRQAVISGTADRRKEAESELMRIEDVEAVTPLLRAFGQDPAPLRLLMVQTLGQIKGKESSRALVNVVLAEPEDQVRAAVVDRLRDRDEPAISRQLVDSLRSRDVRVVNRAAWVLGQLDVVMAVPRLVGALVSVEERLILVPPEGEVSGGVASPVPGPVLMGMNQSYAAYMTGPAVAPGAVGYGAVAVPWFGAGPLQGGTYFGMGATPREPQPRYVNFVYQNVEVRAALRKLTGQDFEYNGDAWRRWIKTSFDPNPTPVRQVKQP